jgi:HSP20 family protein
MKDAPQQKVKEEENAGEGQQAESSPSQAADAGSSPAHAPQQTGTSGEDPNQSQQSVTARERFPLSYLGDGPFTMMRRFSEEMDRFMDRVFEEVGTGRGWLASRFGRGGERGPGLWSPQIEMYERDNQLVVCADLPGLKKENIRIDFSGDTLTIQGERHQECEDKQPGYRRSERSYGGFSRIIPLPEGIDAEKAQATYQDGVLKIIMPMPPQKERRGGRIEIQ